MLNQSYLDGDYLANNPSWHVEDSNWKAQQILKLFQTHRLSPKSICEVGCGAGEILLSLHRQMSDETHFTGFEISPQAFSLCKNKAQARVHFYLGDPLNENTSPFDVVLVMDVVEHVEDCFGFVRRLRNKGTYKVFHFPLDMCAQKIVRNVPIMRLRAKAGHIHYFMKDTAIAILKETGHEVIDHLYTRSAVDAVPKSLKAKFARLPRRALFKLNPDLAVRLLGGYSLLVLTR